ncbi:MAG TPA: CsbD family protein [Rhodopila sp.]|uniref:CsbD family protein n=1 Tax=Rhodopila sp. TaxID=2480087 RepID=UPI002BF2CFE5|nr:CsbD family protein [Rhodopila sp.]HVY14126.1 CsbD family protein [Rhodopila sp.]
MNDRVEGAAREFGGRVQEAVGNATGDGKTQAEGLYNQAAGQAQQAAAQFSDVIKSQPIVATLVAVAVGYILGRLTA